ncbi:MAG: hypothetical protein IJ824_01985 [Alphaproteobacteria bacterium]|nr:hypothetical protein [Alphaproteobacteria bacterium]
MNIIKNLWLKMLAKNGLDDDQVFLLVKMMNGMPQAKYLNTELDWYCRKTSGKTLTLTEVGDILRAYFAKNIPPQEVLPQLIGTNAGYVYVKALARRKKALTDAEKKTLLQMPPAQLGTLDKPLDEDFALRLYESGDEERIAAYLQAVELPPMQEIDLLDYCKLQTEIPDMNEAERQIFAQKVQNCNYITLARDYVQSHFGAAFASEKAQKKLFTTKGCDSIIDLVINQCSMADPFLCDAVIGWMIDRADRGSDKHLRHFLAVSYIENRELLADLLNLRLKSQVENLLNISQLKFSLAKAVAACGFLMWQDAFERVFTLTDLEQKCVAETDADKRWLMLKGELLPLMQKAQMSPVMASWLIWQYPEHEELARLAVLCVSNLLQKYMERLDYHRNYITWNAPY